MNKEEVIALDRECFMPVFARYPIVLSHGEGPYVFDNEGNKYIDFLGGIAVNILGHGHPRLVKAIADQAGRMLHCSNLYYTEQQATLAKKLVDLSGLDKVFFGNSGAEANEGALKLARKFGKTISPDKIEIISAEHCFHGRTLATLTATDHPEYQEGLAPLPAGFKYVPYNDFQALQAMVTEKTCAILLEPIQGEGGVNVPDEGYLEKVRELCDQNNVVLIFDEVQSGMGRTGKMFAYQHTSIKPDIVTLAKGLGGGVPVGAFIASDKMASVFRPGDHGTTFGGNPLICAAANTVLDIIKDEKLCENAASMGAYMIAELNKLKAKYPELITEVRGKGLIIGAKLTRPGRDIVSRCMNLGAIINCTAGSVLRFVPPLNITAAHVDEVVSVLDKALAECK